MMFGPYGALLLHLYSPLRMEQEVVAVVAAEGQLPMDDYHPLELQHHVV